LEQPRAEKPIWYERAKKTLRKCEEKARSQEGRKTVKKKSVMRCKY